MSRLEKYLLPLVTGVIILCLILSMFCGCAPAATTEPQQESSPSLGEILDPSGNPFVNRFSDEKDIRTATFVVAASDSVHRYDGDFRCSGANDHVQIQAALDRLPATGGKVVLLEGNYQITANIVVPASTHFSGMGKGTILTTTDAVGITNMVVINGNNVTISDMKLVLGAGAGDAGSRPNVIYASSKTLIWLENLWIVGDESVAYELDLDMQNGILLATVTDSKLVNNKTEDNKGSGIRILDSSYNTLTGNTSESNGREGIAVVTLAADSEYNVVSTNICNGNSWNGIANLLSSNHNTYDSNACEGNVESGIFISAGTGNTVTGNTCSENVNGISTSGFYTDIVGNTCYGNTTEEIRVNADYANITGNMIWSEVGDESIYLNSSDYCTVSGNSCVGAGAIIFCTGVTNCTITGNLVQGGSGIKLISTSNHNTITGNTCSDSPAGSGITVQESHYNTVSGNTTENNLDTGIYIYRSSYNTISGNTVTDNTEGIYVKGTVGKQADYNFVTSNSCRGNTYNIDVSGGIYVNHTRIIDNETSDSVYLILDAGTGTEFNSVIVPFSDGTTPLDSGYEIDVDAEMARAWLMLPLEVQIVMSIKIYARSVVAEVHEMELEMVVYGGADNEAYNTHDGSIAALDSTSVNFAVDDIIFWTNTQAGTLLLTGGDSIEVKVLHEAAEGDNCETDAFFRTVEIEYQ